MSLRDAAYTLLHGRPLADPYLRPSAFSGALRLARVARRSLDDGCYFASSRFSDGRGLRAHVIAGVVLPARESLGGLLAREEELHGAVVRLSRAAAQLGLDTSDAVPDGMLLPAKLLHAHRLLDDLLHASADGDGPFTDTAARALRDTRSLVIGISGTLFTLDGCAQRYRGRLARYAGPGS